MKKCLPFVLFLLSFCVLWLDCEKDTAPLLSRQPELSLTAEDVTCTEAWLRVQAGNLLGWDVLKVSRDDSVIYTGRPGPADTLLYDAGLLPSRQYSYRASLLRNNNLLKENALCSITTLDTTSHEFDWEVIEFPSPYGSGMLFDAAVINENDIWACGEIYSDSTQPWLPYNAVHWDGKQWELMRVPYYYSGSVWYLPLRSILALSNNDIWFEAGIHWDGNEFETRPLNIEFPSHVNKMWGTSSNEFYIVGNSGLMAHHNGSLWQKLYSGTDLNLRDISGSGDHIFITGHSEQEESITLEVINNRVKTFLYSTNFFGYPSQDDYGRLYSVFALDNTAYIVAKQGIIKYNWERKDTTLIPDEIALYNGRTIKKITGTAVNDLLLIDAWGGFIHFNGASWHLDERILNQFGPATFFPRSGIKKDNLAVLVGYDASSMNAIIIKGQN